jgi:hypothetical protein
VAEFVPAITGDIIPSITGLGAVVICYDITMAKLGIVPISDYEIFTWGCQTICQWNRHNKGDP